MITIHSNTVTCKLKMIQSVFKKYIGIDKRLIENDDLFCLEKIFKEELNLKINLIKTKRLSPMELMVVALVIFENNYKVRASYLCINHSTVKAYEWRAKKKLGVKSKNEAITKLCELGIIL